MIKFLFSYDNLNFWQTEGSTIEWDYNDNEYYDSYDQEISSKIKYLTNEGLFDKIGETHNNTEFGKIRTFSIIKKENHDYKQG